MAEQEVTLYVPVVLEKDQVEALQAAAGVVINSFVVAKQPKEDYAPLSKALQVLDDSLDKALLERSLKSGGGVGKVMLQRLQRQLGREQPE